MFEPAYLTRRQALKSAACGFAYLALAGLAGNKALAVTNPFAPKAPHFKPRAKRVIFLFMQGGVSHVDSYDYKPRLEKDDGKMMDFDDARTLAKTGQISSQRVMKSPWKFSQHGQSGRWVSELFPHLAGRADDYCVLQGMQTEGIAHGPATLFLHTGSTNLIRPAMGSWVTYGLGTENDDLPGFVTLSPSMGNGGPRNFSNAFLPTVYQGTAVGRSGIPAAESKIRNLVNSSFTPGDQRKQFELLRAINQEQSSKAPGDDELEAVINSYELAWRMQNNAPGIMDLSKETPSTLAMYGIDEGATDNFGRQCLMARRLC